MCPQGTFLQGFERVNRASGTRGGTFNYPKDVGECCKVKFVLPSGNALGVDARASARRRTASTRRVDRRTRRTRWRRTVRW